MRPRRGKARKVGPLRTVMCCAVALLLRLKVGQMRLFRDEVDELHQPTEGRTLRGLRDDPRDDETRRQQPPERVGTPKRSAAPSSEASEASDARPEVPPAPAEVAQAVPLDSSTVLVVICFERAELLRRSLGEVAKFAPCGPRVLVSQDGAAPGVVRETEAFFAAMRQRCPQGSYERVSHSDDVRRPPSENGGYHKLARHFSFALTEAFRDDRVSRAIVLEEDLMIAPDFFDFFAFVAPRLDSDSTLLAASAWNDNGQRGKVRNADTILRSDFFPGLGWMLTKRAWAELGPKWPPAYWDDWLREPAQRQGRHFLRPEVCRTYHLTSNSGTSHGEYSSFLKDIQLADVTSANFGDPDALSMEAYDARLLSQLKSAVLVDRPSDITSSSSGEHPVRIEYHGLDDQHSAFPARARALRIMDNIKAGVPRTAYRGVVSFWKGSRLVFLTPPLPEVERRLFHLDGIPR